MTREGKAQSFPKWHTNYSGVVVDGEDVGERLFIKISFVSLIYFRLSSYDVIALHQRI